MHNAANLYTKAGIRLAFGQCRNHSAADKTKKSDKSMGLFSNDNHHEFSDMCKHIK